MKKLAFIFLTALLCAEEISLDQPIEEQATKFGYFSFGGCGWVLPIFSPEASVGLRKLTNKHAWDVQSGASLMGRYFWGQVSYLHFFIPTNTAEYASPYLGIGLSGGYANLKDFDYQFRKNSPYINIPITVGFQWGEKGRNQFFQIQFSPLLITTASFGVGF